MAAIKLQVAPPPRAKALRPEDVDRRQGASHSVPVALPGNDDQTETGDARPVRVRSKRRLTARLEVAALLRQARQDTRTSSYTIAEWLDIQEHAARDLDTGHRPFEVAHLELLSKRLRARILEMLDARFAALDLEAVRRLHRRDK